MSFFKMYLLEEKIETHNIYNKRLYNLSHFLNIVKYLRNINMRAIKLVLQFTNTIQLLLLINFYDF